jgi:hypothetical protein
MAAGLLQVVLWLRESGYGSPDYGVPMVRIVEALAADEDHEASLRPVGERFLLDQLAFERREERFGHCPVSAVSD